MSVTIPSDLLVGVMHAADPVRLQSATAGLRKPHATPAAVPSFLAALKQAIGPAVAPKDLPGDLVGDVMAAADPQRLAAVEQKLGAGRDSRTAQAYQNFESFMLRQSFEAMLPPAESGAFGEGFAGGVWRSMAADQLATLFTERGGIGIARELASRSGPPPTVAASRDGQWPYFQSVTISDFQA